MVGVSINYMIQAKILRLYSSPEIACWDSNWEDTNLLKLSGAVGKKEKKQV